MRRAWQLEQKVGSQARIEDESLRGIILIERFPCERWRSNARRLGDGAVVRLVLRIKQLHLKGEIVQREKRCNNAICCAEIQKMQGAVCGEELPYDTTLPIDMQSRSHLISHSACMSACELLCCVTIRSGKNYPRTKSLASHH